MKCRAVTQDRGTAFMRPPPHPCQYDAVKGGLCKIHAAMPPRLAAREQKLLRKLEEVREQIALFADAQWEGNPS